MSLGWAVDERQDPPLPFAEETVLFGRRVGAQQAAGHVRLAIALSERLDWPHRECLALTDDACARFHGLDDRYGEAYALSQRGHALRWVGRYQACGSLPARVGGASARHCATSGRWPWPSRAER